MRYSVVPASARPHGIELGAPATDNTSLPVGNDQCGWRPEFVLGAPSPGGLMLPPAQPTAAWLYAPRAVWIDDDLVVVADTGNHRVLLWRTLPDRDGAPADVVLGQPDETSEGPAAGGRGAAGGMNLPTGIVRDGERLLIADAWHHRLLVWNSLPTATDTPPDLVIGQVDPHQTEPNAGRDQPGLDTFYWPFGVALIGGRLYVADTGNRRVLVWLDGIPEQNRPADLVLGQPDPQQREENRGAEVAADSFRWPHAFAPLGADQAGVWVADAGNHRVLGWRTHPDTDRPADLVLGQPDAVTGTEFPYISQRGRLRFPYGIAGLGDSLAIADTANNRVLIQPEVLTAQPVVDWDPPLALGQPDPASNGENRWQQVSADSLCWPYGLHWHRGTRERIAVADSGNNRVVVWTRS